MISQEAKDTILEIQVSATLDGHDLGSFEPVDETIGGWQAACRQCDKTVWVGEYGLMYSLLDESCQGEFR